MVHIVRVRSNRHNAIVPIGRAARLAFDMDTVRGACSRAARLLLKKQPLNEIELEECARLDDAVARSQRLLKAAVRNIMLARLARRSRARR